MVGVEQCIPAMDHGLQWISKVILSFLYQAEVKAKQAVVWVYLLLWVITFSTQKKSDSRITLLSSIVASCE